MHQHPRISPVATAVPATGYTQQAILDHFARYFPAYSQDRVTQIFMNAGIDSRSLALLPAEFHPSNSANDLHSVYRTNALALAEKAAIRALDLAAIKATDIHLLIVATCTGYICPGLTARLGAALGMSPNLQRADLVGMGCAGAVPALQRAYDFALAYPGLRAMVVCVEVSSACWFIDNTVETIVGNAICADGAAAAIVSVNSGQGTQIERFHTLLDASFLESVGLSYENGRHRIVLDAALRHSAGPMVRSAVVGLLHDESRISDIQRWVVHAGGRRVLDSIGESLGFGETEMAHSREILRTQGNMSSPTVLFVLERTQREARAGDTGVMIALGPGLAAETALLRF